MSKKNINIAIFASGSGSNAEQIVKYFETVGNITVALILSNNPKAFVLQRAQNLGVPSYVFSRSDLYEKSNVLDKLAKANIDFVVLAGFLWLVPTDLVKAFPGRILNIHPALLPKYGGKGMYGEKVHEAVKKAGDYETGITIHYVNDKYDEGQIVFQATCPVNQQDTPDSIAKKVHKLEYEHFPRVIEETINKSHKML